MEIDTDDIAILQTRAKKLEAAEDGLLKQLRHVQGTLISVRSRIGNLINSRAPISRLPDELLLAIYTYGDPTYAPSSLPSHVVASHVSQRWRRVILGSPTLWTRIWRGRRVKGYPLDLLSAHLERSCASPLHIVCGIESTAVYRAVVAHVYRWSSFTVGNFGYGYSEALLHLATLYAPMLRHLSVDVAVGEHMPSTLFAGGAPLLSSLTIPGSMLSEFDLAFPSLEVLHIASNTSLRATTVALAKLPSLKTLIFGQNVHLDDQHIVPVNMASLTTLEFKWAIWATESAGEYLPQLFSAIRAPNLMSLILRHFMEGQIAAFETWYQPVLRSPFPCLETLTLEGVPASSVFVRAFPRITHITVHVDPAFDWCTALEKWLEPAAEGDQDPWPLLQSVAFFAPDYYHDPKPCDPSSLVAQRIAAGHPLKHLSMDHIIIPSEEKVRWLKDRVSFEELFPRRFVIPKRRR